MAMPVAPDGVLVVAKHALIAVVPDGISGAQDPTEDGQLRRETQLTLRPRDVTAASVAQNMTSSDVHTRTKSLLGRGA